MEKAAIGPRAEALADFIREWLSAHDPRSRSNWTETLADGRMSLDGEFDIGELAVAIEAHRADSSDDADALVATE